MPPLNNPTAAGSGLSNLAYEQFIEPIPGNAVNIQNLTKRWKFIIFELDLNSSGNFGSTVSLKVGTAINNLAQVASAFSPGAVSLHVQVSFFLPPLGWYQFYCLNYANIIFNNVATTGPSNSIYLS